VDQPTRVQMLWTPTAWVWRLALTKGVRNSLVPLPDEGSCVLAGCDRLSSDEGCNKGRAGCDHVVLRDGGGAGQTAHTG
jgi:hypothetical protein